MQCPNSTIKRHIIQDYDLLKGDFIKIFKWHHKQNVCRNKTVLYQISHLKKYIK